MNLKIIGVGVFVGEGFAISYSVWREWEGLLIWDPTYTFLLQQLIIVMPMSEQ